MSKPPHSRPVSGRSHALLNLGVLGGLVLLATWLYQHDPARSALLPPCPFRALTDGLLCPGCGTLRGLHQLLHGHLGRAFALNPAMVIALPLLGLYGLASLWRRHRPAARWTRPPHLAWITLAVICVWWVGRNLTF